MSTTIFQTTPNYTFTENDLIAKRKLADLRIQACGQLPPQYKSHKIITIFDEMRATKLYSALKALPKGVLHHVHFDCCEDEEFYSQHIVSDPIVYLDQNMKSFKLGTKQQAQKQGWISFNKARQCFQNQKTFIKHVSNITMFSRQQLIQSTTVNSAVIWKRFQQKICNFFPILDAEHIFKKYTIHILRKFIKNGYDRIQFRSLLPRLNKYNEVGQIVKVHSEKRTLQIIDEAHQIIKQQNSVFSAGFIFFGLKFLKPQQNQKILTTALQQKWDKTIGIDFVQQEDVHGSQAPFDQVAHKTLAKFPEMNIKKVYHSGQTNDHLNKNVEISIKAGTARVGHGINVLQHPHILTLCKQKQICFEKNPISNLVLNYVKDPRNCSGPILLGLGIPITINPDDPARFGLQDNTMDYYVSYISSNWSLRHLKLIAIHSINHAICSEEEKKQLLKSFNKRWDQWVLNFIKQ